MSATVQIHRKGMAECGYEYTTEDLQESVELIDEELVGVAGRFGFSKASEARQSRSSRNCSKQFIRAINTSAAKK